MSKIDKKNPSSKSGCHHTGTCQQYKEYLELRNRYEDWCFVPITKADVELSKLFEKPRASFPLEKRIRLLELEKEICEAMLLFYLTDCEGESPENGKLKKILKRKIEKINLEARKTIKLLTSFNKEN